MTLETWIAVKWLHGIARAWQGEEGTEFAVKNLRRVAWHLLNDHYRRGYKHPMTLLNTHGSCADNKLCPHCAGVIEPRCACSMKLCVCKKGLDHETEGLPQQQETRDSDGPGVHPGNLPAIPTAGAEHPQEETP